MRQFILLSILLWPLMTISMDLLVNQHEQQNKKLVYVHPADVRFLEIETNYSTLHYCATQPYYVASLKQLLNNRNPNLKSKNGYTPLHVAARFGNIPGIYILLNSNARIEKPSASGKRAIHFASAWNQLKAVDMLVNMRANINAQDKKGYTPLHNAALTLNPHMLVYLISRRALIKSDIENKTPINILEEYYHRNPHNENIIRMLTFIKTYAELKGH